MVTKKKKRKKRRVFLGLFFMSQHLWSAPSPVKKRMQLENVPKTLQRTKIDWISHFKSYLLRRGEVTQVYKILCCVFPKSKVKNKNTFLCKPISLLWRFDGWCKVRKSYKINVFSIFRGLGALGSVCWGRFPALHVMGHLCQMVPWEQLCPN